MSRTVEMKTVFELSQREIEAVLSEYIASKGHTVRGVAIRDAGTGYKFATVEVDPPAPKPVAIEVGA